MDYRLLSLLIPAAASSVGFFCFGVLAFSFTELATLPAAFRTGLVLVGSFALAFGSEVGTLASVVEIYRKPRRAAWDYLALAVSVLATVGARSLSVRQTEGLVQASRDGDATVRPVGGQTVDPDIQQMEAQVREALGTKVTISSGRKGGRITITWYDDEDLGRLVDRLSAVDR